MASILVGGRKVSVDELASVALRDFEVVVDKAVLTKLRTAQEDAAKGKGGGKKKKGPKKGADEKKDAATSPASVADAEDTFSRAETRAIVLVRLVGLLKGQSLLRLDVFEFLVELLNQKVTPVLPVRDSDALVLQHLAGVVNGQGTCLVGDEDPDEDPVPVSDALAKLGLKAPGLNTYEAASFAQGLCVCTAIASLVTYAGSTLLNVADATAALSCEAFQAHKQPFEPQNNEDCRPQKGQVEVANNLRVLLDDSGCVGKSNRKQQDPVALRCIPQLHGPVRDAFKVAQSAVRAELASAEPGPASSSANSIGAFHPQVLVSALSSFHTGLVTLANASHDRFEILASDAKQANTGASSGLHALVGEVDAPIKALVKQSQQLLPSDNAAHVVEAAVRIVRTIQQAIDQLRLVLGFEALAAMQTINERDTAKISKFLETQKRKEEARKAREAQLAAQAAAAGDDNKDNKDNNNKGKGKKGKNKKQKKKKEKPQKPKGLVLGQGTRAFRLYLASTSAGQPAPTSAEAQLALYKPAADTGDLPAYFGAYRLKLDPYDFRLAEKLAVLLTRSNQSSQPKIPKGTRDYHGLQMAIRQKAFAKILAVFRRHGAVGIDTPVFERKETLTNKYGEDSKLIYDLADQGGEMLSLRYDLTVPFARYCATHQVKKLKRYHIARVYRRDQPVMSKGRFREFYQCDYDIAGDYDHMVPDADVLKVLTEILSDLNIGTFKVKINHRKLLDAIMDVCGVPDEKFRTICSAIDKLDKEPWEKVKEEMTVQKGLDEKVADAIGEYVREANAPMEMLKWLQGNAKLSAHPGAQQAFKDMSQLFDYMEALDCLQYFSFDMSLARGLDYYTGVIYEAMLSTASDDPNGPPKVGSIAAGGRYDKLVGMFSSSEVPAVGVSIGIERIFAIMEQQQKETVREVDTEVLVASIGKGMLKHKMRLCSELWKAGVKAEFLYKSAPKPARQLEYALSKRIPFVVFIGETEVANKTVNLKTLKLGTEEVVARDQIVARLKELASQPLPLPDFEESKTNN